MPDAELRSAAAGPRSSLVALDRVLGGPKKAIGVRLERVEQRPLDGQGLQDAQRHWICPVRRQRGPSFDEKRLKVRLSLGGRLSLLLHQHSEKFGRIGHRSGFLRAELPGAPASAFKP